MNQTLIANDATAEIRPGRRLKAVVAACLAATAGTFRTEAVPGLSLGFEGIVGDHHAGLTRNAGGREPWYPRGTEMRNERQVSIVCGNELAAAAAAMGIGAIEPEWIGANLVIEGVPSLSMLPPRTLLFFANGATLKVDGQNAPCRIAGGAIAEHHPDRDAAALALSFVAAARRRRGLVAWVEKPGRVVPGERVSVHVPEQWIYG